MKIRVELFVESQKGIMDKFIKINKKMNYIWMKSIWNMIIYWIWWLRFIFRIKYLKKEIIGLENDKPIDILNYMKIINSFPNAYIE